HANGPADALRRVETMALLGGVDVPLLVVRRQMLRAVDLVVHVSRAAGASRRVTAVAEVVERDDDRVEVRLLADGDGVVGRRRRPARVGGAWGPRRRPRSPSPPWRSWPPGTASTPPSPTAECAAGWRTRTGHRPARLAPLAGSGTRASWWRSPSRGSPRPR